MSVREITTDVKYLRRPCGLVEAFDASLLQLVKDLSETVEAHDGYAVTANQIGDERRAFVAAIPPETEERGTMRITRGYQTRIPWPKDGSEPLVGIVAFVNPNIVWHGRCRLVAGEHCLSLPGVEIPVERWTSIKVRAQLTDGRPFEVKATRLMAVILQHEIDHLNGKLIIDRVAKGYRLVKKEA